MRKLLLLIALFAVASFAVEPSRTSNEGMYYSRQFEKIHDDASPDTIAATGTLTIDTKITPKPYYEYILVSDAATGTGSDSVELIITIKAYDAADELIYTSAAIDTITGAGCVYIPFKTQYLGASFDVVLTGGAANGGQVIVNDMYWYVREPIGKKQNFK